MVMRQSTCRLAGDPSAVEHGNRQCQKKRVEHQTVPRTREVDRLGFRVRLRFDGRIFLRARADPYSSFPASPPRRVAHPSDESTDEDPH